MEVPFSIFISFRVFIFVEFIFQFGFITFWYFFIVLNLNAVECLNCPYSKAYYFYLTVVGFFHGYFAGILLSVEYHFSSLLLSFITELCSEIPWSSVSCFFETSYLRFFAIQPIDFYKMWDLGVGILWQIPNSFKVFFSFLFFFFFCFYFTCM